MGKAQVTVFIILGLVIILAVGIVLFVQKKSVPQTQVVPSDVQPINDYVTGCIDQIGRDGISILGLQGGYITLPQVIERNPNAHLRQDSQGIVKTPFWYYEGEDRTPPLENMERELASYVKTNLPDCISNFEAFSPQITVRQKGDLIPIVIIGDKQIIVTLKWPLEVDKAGQVTPIQGFTKVFPVRLKEMWELADKTMKAENQQGWFENLTIDLMSTSKDIPVSGMEFSCGAKKWRIEQVKSSFQEIMAFNLPSVRVENTRLPPPLAPQKTYDDLRKDAVKIRSALEAGKEPKWPTDVPADVFEVNRMRFNVDVPPTDLKAAFVYQPDWPMLINAQPSHGGTLSSAQMKGARKYLRFLCINQWHFAYDVVYPVEMLIRDDRAFNNEGFVFQFAFPVVIEDNRESRVFFGVRKFVAPESGTEFCTTFSDREVDIKATGFPEGSSTIQNLEDANITYRCMNQECALGHTQSDGAGDIHLSTFLPEGCGNPTVTAQKEGYLTARAQAEDATEIFMPRVKTFTYSLVIHPYYEEVNKNNPFAAQNKQWLENQVYTTFTKTMHATVSLTARNETFEQLQEYGWSELPNGSNTIGLIAQDTAYDLDITLFKGANPVGGYHAENLTIPYEKIASSNKLTFHVVEYRPLPIQGYEQAGMFSFLFERGMYSDGAPYAKALKPTFTP